MPLSLALARLREPCSEIPTLQITSRFILLFDTRPRRSHSAICAWQTAAEMLILATKGERPPMFADIATRKALHADKPTYTAAPAHVRTKIPKRLRQIRPVSASLDACARCRK